MLLHETEAAQSCSNLSVAGIKATGSESTHPPTHAIDNDISTRWSNPGFPSSIQLDLGAQKTICSVTIAWYRGDERQNTFKISISKDDSSYTNVFSGKSSGTRTAGEKYDFVDSEARYVKITVTDNSQSNWASITEIDVSGAESSGTNGGYWLPLRSQL